MAHAKTPAGKQRFGVVSVVLAAGFLLLLVAGGYGLLWPSSPHTAGPGLAVTEQQERELDQRIERFCSECHVFPPPSSFPKDAWKDEVKQGFDFARERDPDLKGAPPFEAVVRYFERRAPEQLRLHVTLQNDQRPSVRFEPTAYPLSGYPPLPGVSNVKFARLSPPHDRVITVCDMRNGFVSLFDLRAPEGQQFKIIAEVPHPAHAEPVDLDGDGYMDLLVADLGSLLPADHTKGQVIWLRRDPASENYEKIVLADGLPRVADVEAADFDGDGDLDLVVAAFGWRSTGELLYLENQTTDWRQPRFQAKTLAKKTGAIHVPIADLNGDGRPDFVALFSQEHEQIVAFINEGGGNFRQELIFAASDPAFGSTGIQLVDLDGDGDIDVLYTNGDSLDSYILKPYHGIQWLENEGKFPFRYHFIATMPGVHRAIAVDLDGDGDLDIIASSFLANIDLSKQNAERLDSLVFLENRGGKFVRYPLEFKHFDHATLDVADVDGDGHPDLIVGNFSGDGLRGPIARPPMKNWLTIWRNLLNP